VLTAQQDAAFSNPTIELRDENRRESYGPSREPEVFATAVIPLDLTGKRLALRSRTAAIRRAGAADSVVVLRDVEAEVARAFWRASLGGALLDLARSQLEDANRLAATEAIRAREGESAELVAMRTRLEADRARIAEAAARGSLASAMAELARAMGIDPGDLPPPGSLEAGGAPVLRPPLADQTVMAYALSHRDELVVLDEYIASSGLLLTSERRATLLPDVSLLIGTRKVAGVTSGTIGFSLPVPLFNQNGAARGQAAAEQDRYRAERRAMEQSVRAEVTAALESYRSLMAALPDGAEALIEVATEVARIADGAYAEGGMTLVELLDARRSYLETLTTALGWIADLQIARVNLLRAVGASPLDSPEGI
jgi:cobalt-zinc-cadmium efflux system outer membrane protein